MNIVKAAIKSAGGMKTLAAVCGVRYQAIQNWRKQGRVPAERVLTVEKATGGQVTRHQLRPDIYPLEREDRAA